MDSIWRVYRTNGVELILIGVYRTNGVELILRVNRT